MSEKTIALCAIAGNVEHLIERFITSFQQLTPHIYIVQAVGGSTPDKTLEIAERLGCKVGIYKNSEDHADWPHVDNFGAARQQAFDMGEAAGHNFLMWADTDDVIDEASVERIKELINGEDFDILHMAYRLSNNGLSPFRERIVRTGTAKWSGAVHEHLIPNNKNADRAQDDVAAITHLPGTNRIDGPNERNVRIIESLPPEARYQFYICQEYEALGRKEDAINTAMAAIKTWQEDKSVLQTCEAYELYIMLSRWTEDADARLALLREAWAMEPWRREALCYMSATYSDLARPQEALALARMAMALPTPRETPWTHRNGLYGWAGIYVLTCALRLNGMDADADKLEAAMFEKGGKKISVLHPVRGRPLQSAMIRAKFLERAKDPASVEYIFAIGEDDMESRSILGRFRHVLTPAGHLGDVGGTYVLNMNTAYRAAQGSVIVGSADDIEAPIWWDESVLAEIGDTNAPAVLGVKDGFRTDDLLITHIFTRKAPEVLGLPEGEYLSSEYRGVYSDSEFSHRAYKAGIVKPSEITFQHHHPAAGKAQMDNTYSIMNSPEAYVFGKEVFDRRNPDAKKIDTSEKRVEETQ